jgi:hypothetical protein
VRELVLSHAPGSVGSAGTEARRSQKAANTIIGATLTPFAHSFKGSPFEGYYTTDKEKVRVAVNTWIRSSGDFDGVIDFDEVAKDPRRPTYIQAAYDTGDHLHPQDDGNKAMADSIDLALLASKK